MKILILNQAFYPDTVSTAQHASDLAAALAEHGHQVTVICSRHGYDDPTRSFAPREQWRGVRILRVWSTTLGKKAKWRRAVDSATFLLSCVTRLAITGRNDLVLAMTSPPFISSIAALYPLIKGGRLAVWIMDLNPDEAIAAGWLGEGSLLARVLRLVLAYSLRRASQIVVLDRFMKQRLLQQYDVPEERIEVLPPWSHDDSVHYDGPASLEFRQQIGVDGKFIVMYAGNHSPCHPLDTLLEAARRLAGRTDIHFCFIGGGAEFPHVQQFSSTFGLTNIRCLPYQPRERLSASLSAADLHVVVMGDPFVGIVHPCKVYNILAVGSPFLYIGPSPSHITDLIPQAALGQWAFVAGHGEVDTVVAHIEACVRRCAEGVAQRQNRAREFSQSVLVERMVNTLTGTASRT